jgi:ATP-dependent RNA helicase DeaD
LLIFKRFIMENFASFGLPEQLIMALAHLKFDTPTPIQAQVIPPALEGRDILASAQTGTGKTAAFGIPLITKLILSPSGSALVVTPTRELAAQVSVMLRSLLGNQKTIKTALLIGGDSISKQLQQLRSNPRLIVGTPGRINDHLMRGSLKLHDAHFLVLDETDRMLDMGFAPQIDQILKYLPKKRQTLLLSATLPRNIVSLAEKFLNDPVRIAVIPTTQSTSNLKQEVLFVSEQDKHSHLDEQLAQRDGSIIVFVKTKMGAERMAKKLRMNDHSADAIHGDLSHNRRERVIKEFRDCKYRIMVATDIAARGLDISHVQHVINFDLPQCPEDYIHRIGRTARAGAEGSAICFISPADKRKWAAISHIINPGAKPEFDDRRSNGPKRKFGPRNGARRTSDSDFNFNSDRPKRSFNSSSRTESGESRSYAGSGEKRSYAGAGEKRSYAGAGEKRPFAGSGEKRPFAGSGEKRSYAGAGEKRPFAGSGEKRSYAGAGEKRPFAGSGEKRSFAGAGEKRPFAGSGEKRSYAGAGKKSFGNNGNMAARPSFKSAPRKAASDF